MINADNLDGSRVMSVEEEQFSPLDLFHPDGTVGRTFSIGSYRLEHFLPYADGRETREADLILWAPGEMECQNRGWLEQSARTISQYLARDGVVYALIPRPWRIKTRQLLKSHGLQPGTFFLHLPDWPSSRYIVPLQQAPAQYAFLNLFPTRDAVRILALTMLRMPFGEDLLGVLLPWAGYIAQRPGSRVPFDWLYCLARAEQAPRSVVLSTSWRKKRFSIVAHCFSGKSQPTAVAKVVTPNLEDPDCIREFANLSNLGETARQAGARVPEPMNQSQVGKVPVFIQSALSGRAAAVVLMGHPERIEATIKPILTWLESWNQATRLSLLLTGERLERELLRPSRGLAPLLPDGNDYADWLANRCSTICDPVPFTTAHHDLTLWNVLLRPGNPPGIVDWSEACRESLPMVDLFYMMVDAIAIAHRIDRERAFLECFSPQGRYLPLVKQYTARLCRTLEMPEGLLDLCLHSCFLHHALNEQLDRDPGEAHPFLTILRYLAQDRAPLEGF